VSLLRNDDDGRIRAPWRLLVHGLLFLLTTSVLSGIFSALFEFIGGSEARILPGEDGLVLPAGLLLAWALGGLGGAFVSTAIAAQYLDRRSPRDLGLRLDRAWWADFRFGLALGGVMVGGIVAVEVIMGWMEITGSGVVEAGPLRFLGEFAVASIAFVCVGVYEEVVVRGYQMTNLAEGLRPGRGREVVGIIAALIASSVAFGLLHGVNPGYSALALVNITLIGMLVLGLGYALTGRLGLPIGLHTSWNFALSFIFGLPVSGVKAGEYPVLLTRGVGPEPWTGGSFGPEGGLLGTVSILAGLVALVVWVRLREGRIAVHQQLAQPPGEARN
jgi:membrane protease YdiL (CAAX protease family)